MCYLLSLFLLHLQNSFDRIYKKGQIMSPNGVQGVFIISGHLYSGEDLGCNYFSPWWQCKKEQQWKRYKQQNLKEGNYSRTYLILVCRIIFTLILIIFYFIFLLMMNSAEKKIKPAVEISIKVWFPYIQRCYWKKLMLSLRNNIHTGSSVKALF